VPPATIRMWEARYGFPGSRHPAGRHRRYGEREAELVLSVLRLRRDGMSLRAAIARACHEPTPVPRSIFAGLKLRSADLAPIVLAKPAILALTRAVEDEHCARGRRGVLVGSFQSERFYRQSERRWRELARTSELAVAIAEFGPARTLTGPVHEVSIQREHPLSREWAIISSAGDSGACLAAWEIPDSGPRRRFEVLWSAEPEVVHVALAVAAQLIAPLAGEIARRLEGRRPAAPAPSDPAVRAVSSQAHRMLAYLSAQSGAAA